MDWFRGNSLARQVLLVAAVCAVLAIGIGAAYLNLLQPRYGVLFSGLRDADAATIVAELDKQKAPYKLEDGGGTILMPSELVAKTRLGLMSTALPLKGTVGFELFNKSDMGLTEFAEQINYQRALQGELSRTIMSMDGVDEARIHLALPEHAIFRDEAKPPKASVTVLTRPGKRLDAASVRGIQRLVAAAVPDLEVANVVVLDAKGDVVSDAATAAPASATGEGRRRAVEGDYEALVRSALQLSFPHRQIDIAVWAGGDAAREPDPGAERAFPLRVAVTVSPPSSASEEQAIRKVVMDAVHADPNRDVISYTVPSPPPAVAPTAKAPAAQARLATSPDIRGWVVLSLLAAMVVGAGLFGLRRATGNRLTPRQRADYAERLKAALEGRAVDGAA